MKKAPRLTTRKDLTALKERLLSVGWVVASDGCWLWNGTIRSDGYGQVGSRRRIHSLAHRVSYETHRGAIPDRLTLDHLCRNRRCINPEHLEPVSQAVNILRGNSLSALNARKNICRRGHPLSGDNVAYWGGRTSRRCRICHYATTYRSRIAAYRRAGGKTCLPCSNEGQAPRPVVPPVQIAGRFVGDGYPVTIVAEASGNHAGSLSSAKELVHAAKESGADVLKVQVYRGVPDMTVKSNSPEFTVPGGGPWGGRQLHELYEKAGTPWEWYPVLVEEAKRVGIPIFTSVFSPAAVKYVAQFEHCGWKVPSFEATFDGMLKEIRRQSLTSGKPVIISTGMATREEIEHAVSLFTAAPGGIPLILMRCVSSYPAPLADLNLHTINCLKAEFGFPVGFSDHSLGTQAPVAAVCVGANVIEKHLALESRQSVDSHFSLAPSDFARMVREVRDAEKMLGKREVYGIQPSEQDSMVFRRSLFSARALKAGVPLTEEDVLVIRPGTGMHPRHLRELVGKVPVRDVPGHTALREEMFR